MIKIEKIETYGWEAAIRGMRNPMDSWDKSDSTMLFESAHDLSGGTFSMGNADLNLAKRLVRAGTDHSKFLRMINVTCDITAPLYWLKEVDTYKIGTVRNSCSTMHKIHEKEFALDDFSCEHLQGPALSNLQDTIKTLNYYRDCFNGTITENRRDSLDGNAVKKDFWWQMIQLLPSSYNQKSTFQFNYQVLKSMYFARRNHKLDEWHDFCRMVEGLPYSNDLICCEP